MAFTQGTQNRHWIFNHREDLDCIRAQKNAKFVEDFQRRPENFARSYLSPKEEGVICRIYERDLRDFCCAFQPPLPPRVTGTALHYFKRFYLKTSVMDIHPRDISMTCVYLACKIEEVNVAMWEFVRNIPGDGDRTAEKILGSELLLMETMNYQLTIHHPREAVEGYLIDIKTRCCLSPGGINLLRPKIDEFLHSALLTDAGFLFSPSEIALAAVLEAADVIGLKLTGYVDNVLTTSDSKENLPKLLTAIEKIRLIVAERSFPSAAEDELIEQKLARCRNRDNDLDSSRYDNRLKEVVAAREAKALSKSALYAKEQRDMDEHLLGTRLINE